MPVFKDRHIDPNAAYPRRQINIPILSAISLTQRAFWLHKFTKSMRLEGVAAWATGVTAAITVLGWICDEDEHLNKITVAVHSTPEQLATTGVGRWIHAGVWKEKAATTAIAFSAAYTINLAASGQKWGAILLQMHLTTGVFSTKTVSADQAYASEALAIAACPAADSGNIAVAMILLQSKNNDAWTAITDDLTAASDIGAINIYEAGEVAAIPAANTEAFSITPAALTSTVEDTIAKHVIRENQYVVVGLTTDGTGAAVNLNAVLDLLPWPLRGHSLVEDA